MLILQMLTITDYNPTINFRNRKLSIILGNKYYFTANGHTSIMWQAPHFGFCYLHQFRLISQHVRSILPGKIENTETLIVTWIAGRDCLMSERLIHFFQDIDHFQRTKCMNQVGILFKNRRNAQGLQS